MSDRKNDCLPLRDLALMAPGDVFYMDFKLYVIMRKYDNGSAMVRELATNRLLNKHGGKLRYLGKMADAKSYEHF